MGFPLLFVSPSAGGKQSFSTAVFVSFSFAFGMAFQPCRHIGPSALVFIHQGGTKVSSARTLRG